MVARLVQVWGVARRAGRRVLVVAGESLQHAPVRTGPVQVTLPEVAEQVPQGELETTRGVPDLVGARPATGGCQLGDVPEVGCQ